MSEIITGTLDDYDLMTEGEHQGRYAIRLDGKPYPVMPHVDAFLIKRRKGEYVDVTVTDKGWVSKITPSAKKPAPAQEPAQKGVTDTAGDAVEKAKAAEAERLKKAGFGAPTTAPAQGDKKQECTSPVTPPAQEPEPVKGEILNISLEKRAIAIREQNGIVHPLDYVDVLDDLIRKQKVGWFVEVSYRLVGERKILSNIRYADRPAGFRRGSNRGGYAPRNEKPMLYESVFKSLCEVFDAEKDGKGKSFEDNARRIWSITKEIAGDMAGISGVN